MKGGKEGARVGGGEGVPVPRPQPRDCKDERPAGSAYRVCGSRLPPDQLGSGDFDRRNIIRHNDDRSPEGLRSVRFHDRRGIEYASPGTSDAVHHRRRCIVLDSVQGTRITKTTESDVRDTIVVVVVVVISTGSAEKPKTSAAAVGNNSMATTVPRRLQSASPGRTRRLIDHYEIGI